MSTIAIIIPCFNEVARLQEQEFIHFLKSHPDVFMVFVNDGSSDGTSNVLNRIAEATSKAKVLNLGKNKGKGEAVRQGLLFALKEGYFDFIGYLDADLSTSLPTFYKIYQFAHSEALDIVLGSRIKKADTVIERTFFRHYVGRIIATIIDKKLKLGIYDTQCGAKVFKSEILNNQIQEPFTTKWFFDIELLIRIFRNVPEIRIFEMPLHSWRSVGNSKINILSFPEVAKDLMQIWRHY